MIEAVLAYVQYEDRKSANRDVIQVFEIPEEEYPKTWEELKDPEVNDPESILIDNIEHNIRIRQYMVVTVNSERHYATLVFKTSDSSVVVESDVQGIANVYFDAERTLYYHYWPARFNGKNKVAENDFSSGPNIINSVGTADILITNSKEKIQYSLLLIPENIGIDEYLVMINDIVRIQRELAQPKFGQKGAVGFSEYWDTTLDILAKRIDELELILKAIDRNPASDLRKTDMRMPLQKAKRVSVRALQEYALMGTPTIKAVTYEKSYDIFEHRVAKSYLSRFNLLITYLQRDMISDYDRRIHFSEKEISSLSKEQPHIDSSWQKHIDNMLASPSIMDPAAEVTSLCLPLKREIGYDLGYSNKYRLYNLTLGRYGGIVSTKDGAIYTCTTIGTVEGLGDIEEIVFDICNGNAEMLRFLYYMTKIINRQYRQTQHLNFVISGCFTFEEKRIAPGLFDINCHFIESFQVNNIMYSFKDFCKEHSNDLALTQSLRDELLIPKDSKDTNIFRDRVQKKRQSIETRKQMRNDILQELTEKCDQLSSRLNNLKTLSFFSEVQDSLVLLKPTNLFKYNTQYSCLYNLLCELEEELRFVDIWGEQRYPVKDMNEVYEYWCFIVLVNIFVTEYGFDFIDTDKTREGLIDDIAHFLRNALTNNSPIILQKTNLNLKVKLFFNRKIELDQEVPFSPGHSKYVQPDIYMILYYYDSKWTFCLDSKNRKYLFYDENEKKLKKTKRWQEDLLGVAFHQYFRRINADFLTGSRRLSGAFILHSDHGYEGKGIKPFYNYRINNEHSQISNYLRPITYEGEKTIQYQRTNEVKSDEEFYGLWYEGVIHTRGYQPAPNARDVCRIGSIPVLPDISEREVSGTFYLHQLLQMIMEHFVGNSSQPNAEETAYRKKCWICGSEDISVEVLYTTGGYPKYHMDCQNDECHQFWVENHCWAYGCHQEIGKHFKNYYKSDDNWSIICPSCGVGASG